MWGGVTLIFGPIDILTRGRPRTVLARYTTASTFPAIRSPRAVPPRMGLSIAGHRFGPDGYSVPAAHVRLNQPIDHECRADMNSILPCVPAMRFDRLVQIGNVEGRGQCDAAVALDPRDNVVRSGRTVGAA